MITVALQLLLAAGLFALASFLFMLGVAFVVVAQQEYRKHQGDR